MEHHSAVFGPDPEAFRPERWLDSDKDKLDMMNRHWMPVSGELPGYANQTANDTSSLVWALERALVGTSLCWKCLN